MEAEDLLSRCGIDGCNGLKPQRMAPLALHEKRYALAAVAAKRSPQGVIDHFVALADGWTNGSSQDDDMTFVVMKVRDA